MKRAIRNLIIGKNIYLESRNEYRQVILSGQYALLSLLIIGFYITWDISDGFSQSLTSFCVAFLLVCISLILHRQQLHCTANYFLFPTLNILLFLIVSSESKDTGSAIFFIPLALGSFAVFNHRQRNIALSFALLGFFLFIISTVTHFSLLSFRHYSDSVIRTSQIINFCLAFVASLMAIYLLINLNHQSAGQLIESNKRLEKLNKELDRFVYSTSHDLRAPLLSLGGLLKLAESASGESEIKKYHEMMQGRLTSLDKFIKDITDYSRNNRQQIVNEIVCPATLVEEIWELLRYSPEASSIEFINNIPPDLIVTNDGNRLRIVLSNLISNAIRYHDQRKENKYIRVSHHLTNNSFSLHIEDNGQGIAPEFQSKIFEMFFRGNESSQGSGLGLYIVKETLAKLSGNIQLHSTPRLGSVFSIHIPNR